MNAIEQLESQHGDIEDLFYELGVAKDVETKARILAELGSSLVSHAASERQLYAAFMERHLEEGLAASWKKQREADGIVATLLEIDATDAALDAKLAHLQELFEVCVEHEETDLFPRIRGLVDRGRSTHAPRGRRSAEDRGRQPAEILRAA